MQAIWKNRPALQPRSVNNRRRIHRRLKRPSGFPSIVSDCNWHNSKSTPKIRPNLFLLTYFSQGRSEKSSTVFVDIPIEEFRILPAQSNFAVPRIRQPSPLGKFGMLATGQGIKNYFEQSVSYFQFHAYFYFAFINIFSNIGTFFKN